MQAIEIVGLTFMTAGVASVISLGIDYARKRSLDLNTLPLSDTLVWLVRILVGVLFCFSGFVKANDYIGFAYKLEEYFEVFSTDFHPFFEKFNPFAIYFAWFFSVLEIGMGVALIVGYQIRKTVWLSVAMMVFFAFLTFYSWKYDAVQDCGCFGDALKLEPKQSFFKDLVLLLMLIPLIVTQKYIQPLHKKEILPIVLGLVGMTALIVSNYDILTVTVSFALTFWAAFMAYKHFVLKRAAGTSSPFAAATIAWTGFIASAIFAYACHELLPFIDYRPYKVGVDIQRCSTEPSNDGFTKCKDFDEIYRLNLGNDSTGFSEYKGNVLVVVSYAPVDAPPVELANSVKLANELMGTDIKVMGLFGATREQVEKELVPQHKIPYQISLRDRTMLKTIIRSNPGYMLLKDGVVMKKWHYNMTPSAQDLRDLLK
ncbi:MAG: DoxX family protein [Bacteroidia bacterium]